MVEFSTSSVNGARGILGWVICAMELPTALRL
jgi:hypothetical protein